MRGWLQDLRLAIRALALRPGYSCLAVLTLALGLGSAITVCAIFDTVLLSPLPYAGSDRLVAVTTGQPTKGLEVGALSIPDFDDYRRELGSFEALEMWSWTRLVLEHDGQARDIATVRVSPGLLTMLGVPLLLGRAFRPEETLASRVVVISHPFWQGEIGGAPDVIGHSLTLNGEPWTVIGVMPPEFVFPLPEIRLWIPLETQGGNRAERRYRGLGRLRPGVALEAAQVEAEVLSLALEKEFPDSNRDWRARLAAFKELRVGAARRELRAGLGAAVLLLLVAAVNVSHMVLVRGFGRHGELATRAALGASRFRIWRLLVAENTALTLAAAVLGVLLSALVLHVLATQATAQIPRADELGLSGRVLGLALALSLLAGPLLGGLSGLVLWAHPGSTPPRANTRRLFTVVQLAFCLVLLFAAGLFARSLERLFAKDQGFVPKHAVAAELFTFRHNFAFEPEEWHRFGRGIEAEVAVIPGLAAVGLVNALPLSPVRGGTISLEIKPREAAETTRATYTLMTPGALAAMGRRLVAGRFFTADDRQGAEPVAVVSEETVRRFFAGKSPLGQTLRSAGGDQPWARVVGVVADTPTHSPESGPDPEVVFPFDQNPSGQMVVVARAAGPRPGLAAEVEAAIWRAQPGQGIYRSLALTELVRDATARRRFFTLALAGFALSALVVVALGFAGVIAYSVRRRQGEIAVRLALGADQRVIRHLVLTEAARLMTLGLGLGLPLCFVSTHAAPTLLFGTTAGEPLILLGSALALAGASLGASLVPAIKASRQTPAFLLRQE